MQDAKKRCIYHIPNYINPEGNSGSSLRPRKMLEAFKSIGYEVDYVMGYAEDRKKQIDNIKQNIKNGVKYEFMYSESSTMPTLLTEKNHLPTHPFLDFGFMKFCKKNGIKIGLYYRDIYWRFPEYGIGLNKLKKSFAICMYKYDIKQYRKILDILYLQTKQMGEYLPKTIGETPLKELPPGCVINSKTIEEKNQFFEKNNKNNINIFYVGGIGTLYNLEPLLSTVSKLDFVNLTVCCREQEWQAERNKYEKYLNNRIKIVHAHGEALNQYYAEADICSLYFPNDEYRRFVLPIKLFEYLGHTIPIIGVEESTTGQFIIQNDIGWAVTLKDGELSDLLKTLYSNRELIKEKHQNEIEVLKKNTWEQRAKQVEEDLGMRTG